MIDALLPWPVHSAEAFQDPVGARLFAQEQVLVARAVGKRRREFTTGRHCARLALLRMGQPWVALPADADRVPVWPAGVMGSITHCAGYRAAAVAPAAQIGMLGIDAEPDAPLPPRLLPRIARPEELAAIAELGREQPSINWDRLLFSAKEAVFKAWFPVARRPLDFADVSVELHPDGTFDVRWCVPTERVWVGGMTGRWLADRELLVTVATVPGSRPNVGTWAGGNV
jgi:4'-phosphopantetheinyl transferase EntD